MADALELDRLGRTFETVLDCGLFHTCDGDERPRYVASVASATKHDGTLYVLCFSSDAAPDIGPHPIRQEELRAAFSHPRGWNVDGVEPATIQTTFMEQGVPALVRDGHTPLTRALRRRGLSFVLGGAPARW